MKLPILAILALGNLCAYSQPVDTFYDSSIRVNKRNVPTDKKAFYFPLALFPEIGFNLQTPSDSATQFSFISSEMEKDTFVVQWYSKHLYAMKEPVLFNKKLECETYRFTWLRTFSNPIAVRIEKRENEYFLIWKVCSGAGGYDPKTLKTRKTKQLSKADWDSFNALLKKCDFWNMELGRYTLGLDGSEWILEGNDMVNYRVVTKWSPDEGAYYDACNFLLELTDLKFRKSNKY